MRFVKINISPHICGCLILSLIALTWSVSVATSAEKILKFHAIGSSDGSPTCAITRPDRTVLRIRSSLGCSVECTNDPNCNDFNFLPGLKTCQLFYFPELLKYGSSLDCQHYTANMSACTIGLCKNGGTCLERRNGWICKCLPGFTGQKCETNINECLSNPCINGGICTDLVNGYSCRCWSCWCGAQCQSFNNPSYNLARYRSAVQSSSYIWNNAPCPASLAVDGDTQTGMGHVAHNGDSSANGWWMVDLGGQYRIIYVKMLGRSGCCRYCKCLPAARLDYFIVGVTNSGSVPTRGYYPVCAQYPYTASASSWITLYCNSKTPAGRYVIIQQPSNGPGYLSIAEFEIYGCSSP